VEVERRGDSPLASGPVGDALVGNSDSQLQLPEDPIPRQLFKLEESMPLGHGLNRPPLTYSPFDGSTIQENLGRKLAGRRPLSRFEGSRYSKLISPGQGTWFDLPLLHHHLLTSPGLFSSSAASDS
jgi:hypothetical protein